MGHGGNLEGTPADYPQVAADLGFTSVEEFQKWLDAGSPTGRCSDPHCWTPALWPHVDKCKKCDGPVTLDQPGKLAD
jgi:hypothetical protein